MDVFDLCAKIRLDADDYESGLSKVKKGLGTVMKIGGAAISAGVAGVAALTKMGVDGYAQYEQLAGGMKKIFDGMDISKIANDAANAYKDLGMSANEYLSVINDVGASFAATMGNEAGYDAAKKGLTAISDYASGTGKNFGLLQQKLSMITRSTSSYQSIADQFSGILPATSAGFLEQAQAAGVLEKKYKSLTDVPIEEYQRAVTDMLALGVEALNLTGNTADEAASTLSGSMAMMKSAWQNLVVGMADENANIDLLINNFVESTAAAAQNLLPRIEQTLQGIGALIEKLSPIIAEALPKLVESLLPAIITAGTQLITSLVNAIVAALPALGAALLDAMRIILTDVFGLSEEQANQFADGVTGAFNRVKDGFFALVEEAQTDGTWLNSVWTGLQETGQLFVDFLVALWDNLSAAFKWCVEQINTEGTWLNNIWNNIQTFISAAIGFIQGVITAFTAVFRGDWASAWSAVEQITETFGTAIGALIEGVLNALFMMLGQLLQLGWDLIESLWSGIANHFATFYTEMSGLVTDNIINPIAEMGTDLYNAGVDLLNEFWDGLTEIWGKIANWWDGLKLSDKEANVKTNSGGKYATGLNYVPYDEFPAILHRGEAVLTAAEARVWRNGGYGTPAPAGGITINQYIQSVPQTPVDFANATEAYFEQARWAL